MQASNLLLEPISCDPYAMVALAIDFFYDNGNPFSNNYFISWIKLLFSQEEWNNCQFHLYRKHLVSEYMGATTSNV